MKKLLALLMAFTLTFQLVTPVFAEEIEETQAATEAVEVETEAPVTEIPTTEPLTTETTAALVEKTFAPTEVTEAAEIEVTEPSYDLFVEDSDIVLPEGTCSGCLWTYSQCYSTTGGRSNWHQESSQYPGEHAWWCATGSKETYHAPHSFDDIGTVCTVCGYIHTHVLVLVPAKEPTCWEPGNRAYYACSGCEKLFKDDQGNEETTLEEVTLEKLPSIASGECGDQGDDLLWALVEDGTLTISGEGAMKDYNRYFDAPWYSNRQEILSVVMEPGATSISDNAFFRCSSLTSVTIPDSVTSIGDDAFYGCSSLMSVTIPKGVTSIGDGFASCSSLSDILVADENANYASVDGVLFNKECTVLVIYPDGHGTVYQIPEGVTSIGDSAFRSCRNLTSVTIPDGVTSIGDWAFLDCDSLTNVTIPEGVTSIGKDAFSYCDRLTSIIMPDSVTSIGDYAFYDCSSLTSVEIPEGVTRIAGGTFSECTSLESVTLPDGLLSIEYYVDDDDGSAGAFSYCRSLKNIIIPDSVTSIGDYAFYNCSSLTSVEIPKGVTRIAGGTFSGCSRLESVTLPDGLLSIECHVDDDNREGAFSYCGSLKNIIIPDSVTSIGDYAFSYCDRLTSIIMPDSVTSIGNYAFYKCSSLTSVEIPEGVTRIAGGTFSECTSLESVTLPDGLLSIEYYIDDDYNGAGAFCNCSSLKSIIIPDGVISIGVEAFSDCSNLISVTIPSSVTTIDDAAFCNTGLTSVTIPKSVTYIGWCAFDSDLEVYYCGTEEEWQAIENYCEDLDVHYNAVHNHSLRYVSGKAATCTEAGQKEYWYCRSCGEFFLDEACTEMTDEAGIVLSALGHTMVETEAKAAACTENGNNRYFTCSTCRKVFKDAQGERETTVEKETLAAIGHTVKLVDTTAPTCTEPGNKLYYLCQTCQRVFKDKACTEATSIRAEEIPALGHTVVIDQRVEPTCTKTGLTEGKHCSVCRDVLTKQAEIPAKGHTIEKVEAKEATCTENGNHAYYVCTACGDAFKDEKGEQGTTLKEESLSALGHEMTKVEAVKPTQEATGNLEYYTCSRCEKLFLDRLGKEETTLEEVTMPKVPYVSEIDLIRNGQLVPETLEVDGQKVRTLSFAAVVQPEEAEQKVTWSSAAPAVARVNQSGVVTLLTSGTAVITAAATDGSGVTAQVTLNVSVPNYAPRLGAATLNLNAASTAGVTVDLVESYGSQILSVSVDDDRFSADYEDNQLTLTAGADVTKGTYPMTLSVLCDNGQTYPYFITVKATQTLPKLAVKQTEKFNLFYRDSQAALTVTGGEVEKAELSGTEDFVLENNDGTYVIRYADPENAPAKPNTKATLSVYFAGYNTPVAKALSISTVNTAPKLRLNPAASTLNSALNGDLTVQASILGASDALTVWTDTPGVEVTVSGGELTMELAEAKAVTVSLYVQADNWAQPVKLTHKITVTDKLPTLKAASGALTLNSQFPSETASTGLILSQGNLSLSGVELTPAAKAGTAARTESDKLNVEYDPISGRITAEIADSSIKNGSYAFNLTGTLTSGTEIPGGTLKVAVTNVLPKAKLSASTVKLNQQLAGEECAAVTVTLTGGEGCILEGFADLPEGMDYEDGVLTVTLSKNSAGGTYSLTPVVSRNGESVNLPTPLTLKVQAYDKAPTFKLTAKGKLDVLDPESEIVYTPKLTNCLGTVEDIQLTGADCDLFEAAVEDGVIHLTMVDGGEYAAKATYKVVPILTVCGQDITGSALSIKVTQSAVKLAKLLNRTAYQSQTAPLTVELVITSPLTAQIGDVQMNSKTTAAFQDALEAAGGIGLDEGTVSFPAETFTSLTPGKYTVILDVTPANATTDAKAIQAKFTLTVQK